MNIHGPYDSIRYFVCHGPDAVHYSELEPRSIIETGQPNCEEFTDEAAAIARAEELGYVFPNPEPLEPLE